MSEVQKNLQLRWFLGYRSVEEGGHRHRCGETRGRGTASGGSAGEKASAASNASQAVGGLCE